MRLEGGLSLSFFDKLKEAGQKAGDQIQKEAKKQMWSYKERQAARKLLDDFNKRDLVSYCIDSDIPASSKMDKGDIIDAIVDDDDFSLEAVQDYHDQIMKPSKRLQIVEEDIEFEQEIIRTEKIKTKVRKKKTTRTVTKLRKAIKNFDPITPRKKQIKERDLEAQMVQALTISFGKDKVNYQERARGGRVDIVVDGKYAIELKIITSPSQLTPLIGQALVYSKEYEKVFVYLYDKRNALKSKNIKTYETHLKDAGVKNVEVIRAT